MNNLVTSLPRIAITMGEAAGIGPELIVRLSQIPFDAQLIVLSACNTASTYLASLGTGGGGGTRALKTDAPQSRVGRASASTGTALSQSCDAARSITPPTPPCRMTIAGITYKYCKGVRQMMSNCCYRHCVFYLMQASVCAAGSRFVYCLDVRI